jgi:hypothetical protein
VDALRLIVPVRITQQDVITLPGERLRIRVELLLGAFKRGLYLPCEGFDVCFRRVERLCLGVCDQSRRYFLPGALFRSLPLLRWLLILLALVLIV